MPDQPIDKARKLQKLGERIRDGFAKEHPAPDRSVDTVRQAIRQEWEKERAARPAPNTPTRERAKEGPEPERE
jgi:hypothetical protein